jgi:hypothetical protein
VGRRRNQPKPKRPEQPLVPTLAPAPEIFTEHFSALELDFFNRAEQMYATTFEKWEDFDPKAEEPKPK